MSSAYQIFSSDFSSNHMEEHPEDMQCTPPDQADVLSAPDVENLPGVCTSQVLATSPHLIAPDTGPQCMQGNSELDLRSRIVDS